MIVPKEYDKLKYIIYSNNTEIDVLYHRGLFNLTVEDMLVLFMCTKQDIADVINQKFTDKVLQQSISKVYNDPSDPSLGYEDYFELNAILEIGACINVAEAKHFSDWSNSVLIKFMMQNQFDSGFKGIHSSTIDFWDEYNMNMAKDPEEGIHMDELIIYLKNVCLSYNGFIDKLIEIEDKNSFDISDVEYLTSIELGYYDRKLHANAYKELGNDIEEKIYIAILSKLISRFIDYMGEWKIVSWSDKIDSLKIKIIQIGVESKQMFFLTERFSYFSQRITKNYDDLINPIYNYHIEQKFNFWDLCAEVDSEDDVDVKRKLFVDAMIEISKWQIEESINDEHDAHCKDYIERCQKSIDLIDYGKAQKKNVGVSSNNRPSTFKLASKKKTDFIKVISAMYDAKIFVGEDGKAAANKQELMEAFGTLLNDDFSKYSSSLAQAKSGAEKEYLKTFETLTEKALEYLNT